MFNILSYLEFSSVQLFRRVWLFATHGWQHARLTCPSPNTGACSNSCPLSWRCHPIISFSVIPFSFYLQSFPASGSFLRTVLHSRCWNNWSFSFSIGPSDEYSGLILFRIYWFNLAVQGSLFRNKKYILFINDLLMYIQWISII